MDLHLYSCPRPLTIVRGRPVRRSECYRKIIQKSKKRIVEQRLKRGKRVNHADITAEKKPFLKKEYN